jgi:hypothetical protein
VERDIQLHHGLKDVNTSAEIIFNPVLQTDTQREGRRKREESRISGLLILISSTLYVECWNCHCHCEVLDL